MAKTSRSLVCFIAVFFCLTAIPAQQPAQDPVPDRNPLECAWYLSEKFGPNDSPDTDAPNEDDSVPGETDPRAFVAKYYWQLGQTDRALQIINRLPLFIQVELTEQLLKSAPGSKQETKALRLVRQTVATMKSKGGAAVPWYSRQLIEDLIEFEQYDEARELAETSGEDGNKSQMFLQSLGNLVFEAQSELRVKRPTNAEERFDRAFVLIQTVDTLDTPQNTPYSAKEDAISALGSLAAGYFALNRTENVTAVLNLANKFADEIGNSARQAQVGALIRGHRFDQAMRLIDRLGFSFLDPSITADSFTEAGQPRRAIVLLDRAARMLTVSAAHEDLSTFDRVDLIRAYLAAGSPAKADQLLKQEAADVASSDGAIAIADWYIQANQFGPAIAVLDRATQKAKARALATVQDETEDFPPSFRPPMAYWGDGEREVGLPDLADRYIEVKAFDKAQIAISAIKRAQGRAAKQADLARALWQAGQPEKAKQLVGRAAKLSQESVRLPNDLFPAPVLAKIASVYGMIGNREESVRLFIRALELEQVSPSYRYPLTGLAEIGLYYEESGLGPNDDLRAKLRSMVDHFNKSQPLGQRSSPLLPWAMTAPSPLG
jgi:tetratricopeptide (TPR) repeat protein